MGELIDNAYKKLCEHDSAYQAMSRVVDTSNIYDVHQHYVRKLSEGRNDFTEALKEWSDNAGILSDGVHLNKQDFFSNTYVKEDINHNKSVVSEKIKYFKLKTNMVLDFRNMKVARETYVSKINHKSIFELDYYYESDGTIRFIWNPESQEDANQDDLSTAYGKKVKEEEISSYPLQRVDRLMIREKKSFFLYINGIKIPDNELFVYANRSWTDVFIPYYYIGNLDAGEEDLDIEFCIDVRQAGSEDFYYRNKEFTGKSITLDLSNDSYMYERFNRFKATNDKLVVFVNGFLESRATVNYAEVENDRIITVELPFNVENQDIEIYLLNDVIYRYHLPDQLLFVNSYKDKVHFFLNDDYFHDIISGPITKNAISFFYDGKRVDDTEITQTSRFSYEWKFNIADFDQSKIDFFVEDMNRMIDDPKYKTYGDDYYLLNMLGVKRCVDKMRGYPSYSVFDDETYEISFRKVLSKSGTQFDIQKTINYYNDLENNYHSDKARIQKLIADKPSIIRPFVEQNFTNPYKKMLFYGNDRDIVISSVYPYDKETQTMYYRVYLNHYLLSSLQYTVRYDKDVDIITIPKELLNAERNVVELYQYDMTFSNNSVYLGYVTDPGFTKKTLPNGVEVYEKFFRFKDLPFGEGFLDSDLAAVEQIKREWYSTSEAEYHYLYANKADYSGYRMVKRFYVADRNTEGITIHIALHEYEQHRTQGRFFIINKRYNVVENKIYYNADLSYFKENDLVFPIYFAYAEYNYETKLDPYTGRTVKVRSSLKEFYDYLPYLNDSQPFVSKNGLELIPGKEYTYLTPEITDAVASSFIVMTAQTEEGDTVTCQFNSASTAASVLLSYSNINIDNKYGLIYLSELKLPFSPEYYNLYVDGEKVSKYDIDILSDKLIRVHHIYRPIRSILVTSNFNVPLAKMAEWEKLYKPTEFEQLVERMFHNCDPSKTVESAYYGINYIYKIDPNEFPVEYEKNHGFIPEVDSVLQAENPLRGEDGRDAYDVDTIAIMFINWFNKSGKTRSIPHPDYDLNEFVARYFSIYEANQKKDRIDIFVDSNKVYDGVYPDICNDLNYIDDVDATKPLIPQYPGADYDLRRRYFFDMFKKLLDEGGDYAYDRVSDIEDDRKTWVDALTEMKESNILYPEDFPLEPDENGIIWTGTEEDIVTVPDPID